MSMRMETVELIQPELIARLVSQAKERGQTVNGLLSSLLDELETLTIAATPQERARAFREWADSHHSAAPPLSAEAISRESIYTREDELR